MRTNFKINQLDTDGDTGVMEISVTPAGKDGKKIALQSTMMDITLNKQVEEELRIMSSAIASSISPIAIANLEGNLTYVNHAFLKMWGYDNDSEVLEKPAVEFWYTTDEAIDVMNELKERGSWAGELVARRKDNSALDVQLSASLAIDERGKSIYMMASFIDITERKQAGEALRDSERRYRLLAENASDAIWTVDMNMKPTYMSPSINLLLGYSVEEAMMKRMEEVFTPASYELAMKTLVQELARENDKGQETTRSQILEVEMRRKDGSIVPVELRCNFLHDPDGKPSSILAIARDITERKMMETKIRELYEQEKTQRKELEEEVKARTVFLNALAHDLKSPLTIMLTSFGLLQESFASRPESLESKLISKIESAGQRLSDRLNDLLDLARIYGGTFKVKPQMLDIKELLEETALRFRPVYKRQAKNLIANIPDALPMLEGDPARLKQALTNILSIASVFSPEGGDITLRVRVTPREIVIEVEDQDTGMTIEEIGMLFEPYHRVEQDIHRFAGYGLIWPISRQIIEAHGGKMWLNSRLGRGNTIGFSLPLRNEDKSDSNKMSPKQTATYRLRG